MKPRSNPFAAVAIALVSATTLHATSYYWDGTDTTAAVADANGGAGAWDTTLTNWNTAATAGSAIAWPSTGTDNDGVFGTPAGLVTIDAGGVSANDLTFGLTYAFIPFMTFYGLGLILMLWSRLEINIRIINISLGADSTMPFIAGFLESSGNSSDASTSVNESRNGFCFPCIFFAFS